MSSIADWYDAAEARWRHLPAGDDRDRRVKATFDAIQEEAEQVALRLPELDAEERCALLHEAVLDVHQRYGLPLTDVEEELFHVRVDAVYTRLCVVAREVKAPAHVQSKLRERRLLRGPGVRAYLGLERDA